MLYLLMKDIFTNFFDIIVRRVTCNFIQSGKILHSSSHVKEVIND